MVTVITLMWQRILVEGEEAISPRVSITGTKQRPLVGREETISPRVSIIQDEDQNLGQNLLHQEVATTTVGPLTSHFFLLRNIHLSFFSFSHSPPLMFLSSWLCVCLRFCRI